MWDLNIFQTTLSKTYISAKESYRYVNLGSRYGLKYPKIFICNFKYLHASKAFFAPFGLPNESNSPKDNKGDSICKIEIYSLLSFSKTYISVQESYRYVSFGSRYCLKCPKMVPNCLSARKGINMPRGHFLSAHRKKNKQWSKIQTKLLMLYKFS